MILRTFLLTAAVLTRQLHGRLSGPHFRRNRDKDIEEGKYRFVVPLVNKEYNLDRKRCTGTLISPNWVLTASNCLTAAQMQFDELDQPINETNSIRQVLQVERPPSPTGSGPDLGLIFVKAVPMNKYGKLSAVDYKAIAGHLVVFVGFGPPLKNCSNCVVGPLRLGEGVLNACNADEKLLTYAPVSRLCVAPKCSERARMSGAAEPGSPVFHGGKLAGVHMSNIKPGAARSYTPISPYLSWIQRIVTKPKSDGRAGDDIYMAKQSEEYRKTDLMQMQG